MSLDSRYLSPSRINTPFILSPNQLNIASANQIQPIRYYRQLNSSNPNPVFVLNRTTLPPASQLPPNFNQLEKIRVIENGQIERFRDGVGYLDKSLNIL